MADTRGALAYLVLSEERIPLPHISQTSRGLRHEILREKPWKTQRFGPFPAEATEEPNG
jgi:hypothetical protein